MNEPTGDRRIAAWLEDEFKAREPAGLLDEVLATTAARRQRPAWRSRLVRLLPLPIAQAGPLGRRKESAMTRPIPLGIGLAAVLATVLVVSFIGSRLPPGGGPVVSPSPSAVPAPAETSATVTALGSLEPGRYSTAHFLPHLAFTVPAAWSVLEDDDWSVRLQGPQQGTYCPNTGPNWGDSCYQNAIEVTGDRVLASDANECEGLALGGAPDAAASMAAVLAVDPRFEVTDRRGITVGGLTGEHLLIRVASTWTGTCNWSGGDPAAMILTAAHPPGPFLGVIQGEQIPLLLLDAPDGVIAVTLGFPFEAESMRIVNTFLFGR